MVGQIQFLGQMLRLRMNRPVDWHIIAEYMKPYGTTVKNNLRNRK